MKLGPGLWNHAAATYLLEAVLLTAGLWLYPRSTTASSFAGEYGMALCVLILLVVNAVNIFGPPYGDSKTSLAVSALVM